MWPCSRQCKCWVAVCLTTRQIDFPKLFWCCLLKKWTYNFCNKTYRIYLSTTGSAISQCADTLVSCKEKTFVPVIEKSHTVWLIRERRGVQHNNAREEHLSFILPGSLTKPLKRRHASCPVLLPVAVVVVVVWALLSVRLRQKTECCACLNFNTYSSCLFASCWVDSFCFNNLFLEVSTQYAAKEESGSRISLHKKQKTKTNKQSRVYMLLSSHVSTSFLSCRCIRGGKGFDERCFYRLQPQGATGSQTWRQGGGSCGDGSHLLRWTGEEQCSNVCDILHQYQVTSTR